MAHDREHNGNGAGYEVEDASVREVVYTGIGLAVGTIIVCFAVAGLMKVLTATDAIGRKPMTEMPTTQAFPPTPRLQNRPREELGVLRQNEDQSLTTYGWVNKDAGTVRIPIDQAMDGLLKQGLPVRAEGAQSGAGMPKTGMSGGHVPSPAQGFPNRSGAKANAPQR